VTHKRDFKFTIYFSAKYFENNTRWSGATENVGVENAGAGCGGGKCRSKPT